MVWGQHAGKPSNMTFEAFRSLAQDEGLDVSDEEYLRQLFKEVQGLLQDLSSIAAIGVGPTEPWGFHAQAMDAE